MRVRLLSQAYIYYAPGLPQSLAAGHIVVLSGQDEGPGALSISAQDSSRVFQTGSAVLQSCQHLVRAAEAIWGGLVTLALASLTWRNLASAGATTMLRTSFPMTSKESKDCTADKAACGLLAGGGAYFVGAYLQKEYTARQLA